MTVLSFTPNLDFFNFNSVLAWLMQPGNSTHACTDDEDSSNHDSESCSSGHCQQQPTAERPFDQSSSSEDGGFWQKRRHGKQQQSATGTWDFDTDPGEQESGQASSSASSHDRKDKQMLYIQMEFCPRTLKKILVAGPIEEADAWQV